MISLSTSLKMGSIALMVGMLTIFLIACSGSGNPSSVNSASSSFQTTTSTSDKMFRIQFSVTPNHLGENTFIVKVADAKSGKAATSVQVRLSTTMLDMDMGTNTVNLQPNGPGSYRTQGELAMSGHWQIRILVRTADNVLHEATIKLDTAT
jgi:copper transport protein